MILYDVVPGRTNWISMSSDARGTIGGQCSEICGAFHGYMPLVLLVACIHGVLAIQPASSYELAGWMAQYCNTVLSQLAGPVQLAGWLAGPASQLGYTASWAS